MDAASGRALEKVFAVSTRADVDRECRAASDAFDPYRLVPLEQRAAFLGAIASEIEALGDTLLAVATRETGLPLARLAGERGRTVSQLRFFARVILEGHWRRVRIDSALPEQTPPRADLRLRMVPVGPVAIFGASNFPLAFSTAGGDTASALAAGCPVVVRGHPAHPGTDALVADAVRAAAARTHMPEGTFGHVVGPEHDLGAALVQDPRIAAVGFTGSRTGGLALVRLAQQRAVPIPVYAEMSCINPVLILPAALADRPAALGEAFVQSLTIGAGQFCTNPGLILVVEGAGLAQFISSAREALAAHTPQPMLTPGIRAAFARGAKALADNPAVTEVGWGLDGDGHTSEPARLFATDATALLADSRLVEEVFGAASLIVLCKDTEELLQVVVNLEGQLTATLHLDADDHQLAQRLMPILERRAGRILANGWPTGVEVAHAMVHGGPYPATSDGRSTSVGSLAIERFLRPVCYQGLPDELLPPELCGTGVGPRLLDGDVAA